MTLLNARIQTQATRATDPAMLVLSADEADLALNSTDFIFDFSNPACFASGALPADGAAIADGTVCGFRIDSPGNSALPDQTKPLVFSSGPAGIAATITIIAGKLSALTITNPGAPTQTSPTVDWNANGVGGVQGGFIIGICNSLTRGKQPAIVTAANPGGRIGQVVLSIDNYALPRPKRAGKGLAFPTPTGGLTLFKTGAQSDNGFPRADGFVSFVEAAIIRPIAGGAQQRSVWAFLGAQGGVSIDPTLSLTSSEIGETFPSSLQDGGLALIAKIVRFNIAQNTSTQKLIIANNGAFSIGSSVSGAPPQGYNSYAAAPILLGARNGDGGTAFNGTIYRFSREYLGLSDLSDAAVISRLRREYAYALAKYGA